MTEPIGKLPSPSIPPEPIGRYRWVGFIIARENVIFGAHMAKEKSK
jgi:hypothetical protein